MVIAPDDNSIKAGATRAAARGGRECVNEQRDCRHFRRYDVEESADQEECSVNVSPLDSSTCESMSVLSDLFIR